MKIFAVLVIISIFLFEEIEPRPSSARRYSSAKSTQRYYDSDSDDGFSSDDDFSYDNDSDDDSYSNSWDDCPTINNIISSSVSTTCKNGILYVNDQPINNVKRTDRIDIISNDLIVNGKVIRHIPPIIGNNIHIGNFSMGNTGVSKSGCPGVVKIGCFNVSNACINGKFYINGEWFKDVKSTDRVEIISNNLKINGKFIRYIPPSENGNNNVFEFNDNDEDEESSDVEEESSDVEEEDEEESSDVEEEDEEESSDVEEEDEEESSDVEEEDEEESSDVEEEDEEESSDVEEEHSDDEDEDDEDY